MYELILMAWRDIFPDIYYDSKNKWKSESLWENVPFGIKL